ncbi:chromatin modification-like protein EAF6, variant [Blastomyces dermatitidis ATCC 18188]|uniref:Chromatin modification-related protein EAF6 n=1 Tax=Ajellomyces dermatitidis (strain ATCC 18188 / CBS 674.68) TaxID=653446 RepID=F2T320_AJEDA|nr:chromatin modification-like protein EAF6 [Blastomyces dermatitidis ATCC 18188]KMW66447.1 chromatin modification-like protein EAF6, variant [Blastomyces dermatitidis ATCC 18188]
MTENIPPATAAGGKSIPAGSGPEQIQNRGIPYYEKLRRELRETIQKKRLMDKNMAALEESIYRFEQSYLEETGAGNIIKGFDNYIKGSSGVSGLGLGGSLGSMTGCSGTGGPATRRKTAVQDSDRVFSRSSASFMRDSPAPSSANTTPSHAPTPTSASMPGFNRDNSNTSTVNNNNNNNNNNNSNMSAASSVKASTNKKKKASAAANTNTNAKASGGSANSNNTSTDANADAGSGGRGRERDGDDDAESGGNKQPVKRLKITYGRE